MDDTQLTPSGREDTPESPGSVPPHITGPTTLSRGACEACKARKIRCDRESPCSQCQRAHTECIHPAIKRKEKRTRILLTPQYERKIDHIDCRLAEVIGLLQGLATHPPIPSNTHDTPGQASSTLANPASVALSPGQAHDPGTSSEATVEGSSSLSAHSIFVDDFLRNFVGTQQRDSEIRTTLHALADMVSTPQQALNAALPSTQPSEGGQQKKFELPPLQEAAKLIREAKACRLAGTGWVYEYITMQSFSDLCLEVYFSEDTSPYDFISINAGLFSLFWDNALTSQVSQERKERELAYARLCRKNLESSLANLPLHLPASANVIVALIFGAFYAMEFLTSSLCWSLTSKASDLCQTLGYHRESASNDLIAPRSNFTGFLFWTTYYLDKSLSLRLGRASSIQDWDVTLSPPMPPLASNSPQEPILAFFVLWIKTARCQGNIYELLYSPAAITQPGQVRQARANTLVASLHEIAQETERTKTKWLKLAKENAGDSLMDFYAISDEILRLSLLTHVHRAAPRDVQCPTTFSPDCVHVARATLDKHHDCMEVIDKSNSICFSTYVHWTLLFAPFVPFIVLFCHVMETRDRVDLARLDAFTKSIHAATTVSDSAARMHRLFEILHNIAARYIELDVQDHHEQPSAPTMDVQLAALGFPHAGFWDLNNPMDLDLGPNELQSGQNPLNPLLWTGNGVQLENWLYENQTSMASLQSADTSFA